ncbi:hypothetical protein AB0F36_07695 [Streptomyces sp. NPDC029080]|uniref:hypothetical protein n=1 Tax=Streptomyces sp. NPDC029080 TaxID=3155017 RepID=UPI00340C0027
MSENEMNGPNPFEAIFGELEDQFNEALMEKRASIAVSVAGVAGLVYRAAVAEGVPADLAKVFAAEYWEREMHPPVIASAYAFEDQDEDDE